MILTRAPKEFVERYLPELLLEYKESDLPLKIDISHAIAQDLLVPLLRFYYTASYYNNPVSSQSSISDFSVHTPINTSPLLSAAKDHAPVTQSPPPGLHTQDGLEQLGIKLGTAILPPHCESVPDFVQLLSDLKRMRDENIATDVTISIISSSVPGIPSLLSTTPDNQTHQISIPIASFKAHRFLLAAQSSYFHTLFCAQFQEASSATVHLTDDLFNEAIVDLVLNYFYTDKIIVKPLTMDTNKVSSRHQRRLQHNKHALRVIQKAFYAADYLGHSETLGQAILHEMEVLCHGFKCVCSECAALLPSMLAWSDKHIEVVPKLRRTLVLLYADPVHSLASVWSQRPFALLITSMVPSAAALGKETLTSVLKQEPLFRERAPKTLVHEIEERIFYNVTKHNAIHVLHSLHLCLSQIRSADPSPSWSRPTLDLVNPLLYYTVSMVSQFFDFYCVEYPILLSCVDGIGVGFSVDFLDFLLLHVLNDGIRETNAGIIYQGIVKDLVGRQEVVQNMAIDDVLIRGRIRCATYIARNWTKIKAQGGFRTLEKSTMRQLAEDTNIPYRSLTKPFETDFSTIFSFKPRKSKKLLNSQLDDRNATLTEVYTRRLSLGNLMTRSLTVQSGESSRQIRSRPRALSTEFLACNLRRYHSQDPTNETVRENQPLLNLLSLESEKRRKQLEEEDEKVSAPTGDYEAHQIYTTTQSNTIANTLTESRRPLLRTSSSFTSLTDQLLPVEAIVVSPPSSEPTPSNIENQARPTRLKFELPRTPARSKSPSAPVLSTDSIQSSNYLSPQQTSTKHRKRRGSKSRRSRWSIGTNSDVSDDDEPGVLPVLGDKVELLRRPLPTMGIIKYIGPVQFAEGRYIGVELESRCKSYNNSFDWNKLITVFCSGEERWISRWCSLFPY
jgi:hypothetical protein